MHIAKKLYTVALTCGAILAPGLTVLAAPCANPDALGVSRTLVVDPNEHIRLGAMQYRETLPLADHEVVLTFDDGPLPPYSTRILEILAHECVKATYFMVGSMARAYPKVAAHIAAEGHTIGTHSQHHPLSFHRMKLARAQLEIQDGIASVKAALGGQQPAPFFRIPGLLRAAKVENYLASQGVMTWSADIPSDDWRRINNTEIVRRTLERLEARGKGIILMHDIKPATSLALPILLRELKARGYHVVHVVPASGSLPKTATLPDAWLSRVAAVQPPQVETKPPEAAAPTDASPKTTASRTEIGKQREVSHRQESARTALLSEKRLPDAMAALPQPPSFFSSLLRLPWRILQ